MMKTYSVFFNYTIKCGDEPIHTEIIRAEISENNKNIETQRVQHLVKMTLFSILFARDSMSFYSRVRPIRERALLTKQRLDNFLDPLVCEDAEEQWKDQMKNRDKTLGYFLDESLQDHY